MPFKPTSNNDGLTLVYVNFTYKVVNTFGMISVIYDAVCTVGELGYRYNGRDWYDFEETRLVTIANPVVRVSITGPGGISKDVNLLVSTGMGGGVLSGNSYSIILDAKTPEEKKPDNYKITPIEVISVSFDNTTPVRSAIARKLKTDDYNTLISRADDAFRSGNFAEAKKLYINALSLFGEKTYPREQLEKIKAEEEKVKNEDKIKDLVKEGDEKFNSGDFQGARQKYEQVQKMQPDDNYTNNQIQKIKQEEDKVQANKLNQKTGTTNSSTTTANDKSNTKENSTNDANKTTDAKNSADKTKTSNRTAGTLTEEEKRAKYEADALERKAQADAAAAEAKRKEEEANRKRQEEYDKWKVNAQKERNIQDAAAIGTTLGIFTYLGGFIYEGMGDVDPYSVYQAPSNKFKPLFSMQNAFGFSGSIEPLLFQSNYSTMVNGNSVSRKSTIADYGYYLNIGSVSKFGLGNDFYNVYGLLGGKLGLIPTFAGFGYNMNIGLGGDIGFKNIKFYTSYKYNAFDYRSFTSSDVEEAGEGEYDMPSDEIEYGIKFTFGGNKDDDFKRNHIYLGFIDKSYNFDGSYQAFYDVNTKSLKTSGAAIMEGYSFEWRQDHTFSLFFHYFEEHILAGTVASPGIVNVTPGTDVFFEIGFTRAFDLFVHE